MMQGTDIVGRVGDAEQALAVPAETASGLVPPGFDPSRVLTYRLTDNADPEERLEEAALWKAMHDEYGNSIRAVGKDEPADFGRCRYFDPGGVAYWTDPSFLDHCARRFSVVGIDDLAVAVGELHADGLGAFIKSTRDKHVIFRAPVGVDPFDEIGALVYSFIDGGPALMVQELCRVEYEFRFFVIDRQIVTGSPNGVPLTPLDFPYSRVWQTPMAAGLDIDAQAYVGEFAPLVERIAAEMVQPHAVIDTAYFNGRPGIVEFNPMHLGGVGLFACDVRALARSSRKLTAQGISTGTAETLQAAQGEACEPGPDRDAPEPPKDQTNAQ